jgi:hypothetical protein
MNKSIFKSILAFCFFVILSGTAFSQDEKDNSPVYSPWACSYLIDNQTVVTPEKGLLEFVIHHRFGKISEISDLFGIYAPSNIRLGFNYGVTNKLMLAVGTEKDNKMQEFGWKYNILSQTKSNSVPVALSYYGNVNLDARDKEVFGENYKFTNRFCYFHQLIVGRKFTDKLSFQVAGGYSHFNAVDSINYNDYIGIHAGGRYKVHNDISILAEYDYAWGLTKGTIPYYKVEPKPNYALGVEFGTGTHAFQLFAAQYKNIVNQKNMGYNQNALTDGHFLIGFNITVRFY